MKHNHPFHVGTLLNSFCFWITLLLILIILNLLCGASSLPVSDLFSSFGDPNSTAMTILLHIRLPRICGAIVCGSSLAAAGYTLQSLLNNPLAAPHSMGLQAGAGFGQTIAGMLFSKNLNSQMPGAFTGCLSAGLCISLLAFHTKASRTTLILAGLAISQIFSAGIDLIITLDANALTSYAGFKAGSLAGLSLSGLLLPGLLCAAALLILMVCSSQLEILSLGADMAASLGLSWTRWMQIFLLLVCLLCASVVSIAGLIGFVGLIAPHLVKKTMKGSACRQLCGCMIQGSCLLLLCDLLARVVFAPFEIPVGIVLSLLGGPYFLWLLLYRKAHRPA